MKNPKNKRTIVLLIILLGLAVVAYRVVLAPPSADISIDENIAASAVVESILSEVEGIKFDTSVTKDPVLNSLKSIESPLPSLPIGKQNPFSAP